RDTLQTQGISAIYSTHYRRTQQTAGPLAAALNLDIRPYSPWELNSIFEIIAANTGGKILIVGHSNTTPNFINYLLGDKRLAPLREDEYDKLFEVRMTSEHIILKTHTF
ncbi:MAG: hypothetical protein D6772_06890, partial [Bacteroidetes bacterium]